MRASWSVYNICWSYAGLRSQSTLLVRAGFANTRACRRASTLDGHTAGAPAAGPAAGRYVELDFPVVSESVVHQRYLTLFNRRIRFPAVGTRPEVEHDYDIVGHPQADFHFCVTFPFHPLPGGQRGGEVTLLREHCQGPNKMMYVLPTGGFDPRRHSNRESCARAELSEEAHLAGGDWRRLLPDDHAGLAEVKWSPNRFTPFLCIGPEADGAPGARDLEEFIEVHRVGLPELRALMTGGDMLLPSVATCFLALERLHGLGLVD